MHPIIETHKPQFADAAAHCKEDLGGLRTGRASAALVEDISVAAYGTRQPLKALATILTPDPRTISIEPWDKSVMADIEKGIRESGSGLNPSNDGRVIRISIPALTEEARRDMIKVMGQKLEAARIVVRQLRDKVREEIQKAEKEKEIGEDDRYTLQEQLDELVKEFNEEIKKFGDDKEKDIMTI